MSAPVVFASLAVVVMALLRLFRRGGTSNVLLYVAAFFAFTAYGPVINLLTGADIYIGIVQDQINSAVIGFALALVGMVAADAMAPQRTKYDDTPLRTEDRGYDILPLVFVVLIVYACWILATAYPMLLSGNKNEQIAAAGPGHYVYLLIAQSAVSLYFVARRTTFVHWLWAINLGVYVLYCLLTSERDFLFALFALVIHRDLLANKRRTIALPGLAVGGVIVGSLLFAGRANEQLDIAGVFNQGSILFVDTFLMQEIPAHIPFEWGATYGQAFVGLLPHWLIDTGRLPLDQWLVNLYAPSSGSGYGFSLTAEAYMNFGLVGIPVMTFLLALAHRWLVNRADCGNWYAFFSVYSTMVWMFAMRGDFSQIVKSLLYGMLFFGAVYVISTKRRPNATNPELDRPATTVHTKP